MYKPFFLLLDTCICCAYAVTMWLEHFQADEHFKGVLLREDEPPISLQRERDDFHRRYAGQQLTDAGLLTELRQLYPYLDEAEEAMLKHFGLPKCSINHSPNTFFLGKDINGEAAQGLGKGTHWRKPALSVFAPRPDRQALVDTGGGWAVVQCAFRSLALRPGDLQYRKYRRQPGCRIVPQVSGHDHPPH